MESNQEEEVQYTGLEGLVKPIDTQEQVKEQITKGLQAPEGEWKQHFEALTLLRAMNKHYPEKYITELFPQVVKNVVTIAEGLRSKLSKQALTLLYETVKHNNLQSLEEPVLNILVESLFKMSNSEKKFIKQEARSSIVELESISHPGISFELSLITLNNNYNISELAISTLKKRLEKHMISPDSPNFNSFMKLVIGNLNAGRAVLQKTAKEILNMLIKSFTDKMFREQIMKNLVLSEQEQKLLNEAIKEKQVKGKGNFKDFLKSKKGEDQEKPKQSN